MPISRGAFQATTTATQMLPAAGGGPDVIRRSLTIRNMGPNRIYVGEINTITTATGFPIEPFASMTFDKEPNAAWFCVAESANQSTPGDTRYIIEYGTGG